VSQSGVHTVTNTVDYGETVVMFGGYYYHHHHHPTLYLPLVETSLWEEKLL